MNLKQTFEEERKLNINEIRKHQEIYNKNHSKRQRRKLDKHYIRLDEIERIAKSLGIKFEKSLGSSKPCGNVYYFKENKNNTLSVLMKCEKDNLCPECKEKYSQERIKVNPCSVTKSDNILKSEPNDTANDTKLLTIIIGLWQRKQVTHLGTLLSPIKIN